MKNENLFNAMMNEIHRATNDKNVAVYMEKFTSDSEHERMEAQDHLYEVCKTVAKQYMSGMTRQEQFDFVEYLIALKIDNVKATVNALGGKDAGYVLPYSWVELKTCHACIEYKNQEEIKLQSQQSKKGGKIKAFFSKFKKNNNEDEKSM